MNNKNKKSKNVAKGYRLIRNIALVEFCLFIFIFIQFLAKPSGMPLTYRLETIFYDLKLQLTPEKTSSEHTIIAGIDDKSIKQYGRWPWDRSVIAEFIETVMKNGAKGVVFDIIFSERVKPKVNPELRKQLEAQQIDVENFLIDGDKKLSEVLNKYGKKISQGTFFLTSYEYTGVDLESITPEKMAAVKTKNSLMLKTVDDSPPGTYPLPHSLNNLILPHEIFLHTSAPISFFSLDPDVDGIIRRYPVIDGISLNDQKKWITLPSLALAALEIFHEKITTVYYSAEGVMGIKNGSVEIPVDPHSHIFINYFGTEKNFNYFSIADAATADVKDKIVFVGSTAYGAAYDMRATPISNNIPGVFVHATMFENMINNNFLQSDNLLLVNLIPILILLIPLLFIKLLYNKVQLWTGLLISFSLSLLLILLSFILSTRGYIMFVMTPLVFLWFHTIVIYVGKYFFVDKERGHIKKAFSRYLDPKLLTRITEDLDQIKLYGEKREIVAVFSDIVGFTTLSESMPPEQLIQAVNRLFTPATAAVFEEHGFLDKYMGDAMMALYGAPLPIDEKERHACRTAVKIIERMDQVRKEFKEEGRPDVKMGVGVNAGDAIVGNMGSEERFNYSAIGDAVNTASRLEGLTRMYGVRIITSEKIYENAQDEFVFRQLDVVKVKGKTQGVKIYELCCRRTDPQAKEKLHLKEVYEMALKYFVNNRMNDVIGITESSEFKNDSSFKFLHDRAVEIKKSGEEYKGVWGFKAK